MTDPNGHRTTYAYDADDRLTTVTDALSHTDVLGYDAAGRLTKATDPNGHVTSYAYDAADRLTSEVLPANGAGTGSYAFAYDPNDNLTTITDPLGHLTTLAYDVLDRVTVRTVSPDGTTKLRTTYGYDAVGNLASVTDPPVAHDQLRLRRPRPPQHREPSPPAAASPPSPTTPTPGSRASRTPLPLEQPDHLRLRRGRPPGQRDRPPRQGHHLRLQRRRRPDPEDRPERPGDPVRLRRERPPHHRDLGLRLPAETVVTAYDPAGRVTGISDTYSQYAYTYDNADRLTSVDNSGTPTDAHVVLSYVYDNAGNRTALDDSLGGLTSYTYDNRNELTSLTQSGTGVASKRADFAYDVAGRRTTLTRYSDLAGTTKVITTTYGYDQADRLTGITDKNSGGTVVSSYAYTIDDAGRLRNEARVWTVGAGTASDTLTYSYYSNDQLTGVTHTNGSFATETYTYDRVGNRNTTGYTTGSANELTGDGTYTYAYDDEGNLTSRTKTSTGDQTLYKWDYRNRLTEVDSVVGVTTTVLGTYTYDALDRRIGVKEGSTSTWTVFDGMDPVLDFNASGTQTARYLQGPVVDEILARETSGSTVAWYLADRLGTVRDVVNNSGGLIDHVDYDSFGNVVAESAPSSGDRFKFTGMQASAAAGLNFDNARWYSPSMGRFVSRDPWGFKGGDVDLYRYVANNSANAVDTSGFGVISSPTKYNTRPEWEDALGDPFIQNAMRNLWENYKSDRKKREQGTFVFWNPTTKQLGIFRRRNSTRH